MSIGSFIPYIAAAAAFLILFIWSHGFFRASAEKLLKTFPALKDYAGPDIVAKALMIILAADLLGAAAEYSAFQNDTAAQGYLMRNAHGDGDDTAELEVDYRGEKRDVDLSLKERQLSAEEIAAELDSAEAQLEKLVLGEMPADHVDCNVTFPTSIDGSAVSISWMTSRPDLLDFEGMLTDAVPEEGAELTISAEIVCSEEIRESAFTVTVYPRILTEEEALNKAVASAVASQNSETEQKVTLPGTVNGSPVSWSLRTDRTGIMILFMGGLIGVFFIYSRKRVREIEEEKKLEQMKRDYPNIVSKLVLLTSAGLSMRKAFEKIRRDYLAGVENGGAVKPGYEEIVRMSREMEHGLSETEAYTALGKRCKASEYRTFASVLVQSASKGGSELAGILRQEAFEAYEERKKHARVLGEEAGTKLLLPMVLMLGIVMAILMVPAFLGF